MKISKVVIGLLVGIFCFSYPAQARFLQTDPVGYQDDVDLYTYVGNDPTDKTDPTGMINDCVGTGNCPKPTRPMTPAQQKAFNKELNILKAIVGIAAALIPGGVGAEAGAVAAESGAVTTEAGAAAESSAAAEGDAAAGSTLKPGPNAGESVPASGPKITPKEQQQVNRIGNESGCHTCGTRTPGTRSGNFVGDHQPPNKLNPSGGQQRLYPQCLSCSRRQGGEVNRVLQQLRDPTDTNDE